VATGALARALLGRFTLGHLREVMALLRLRERYDDARLERACRRALEVGDGRYQTVQRILERGLDAQTEDLYELVSRRHRRGSLIVTTNRDTQDLYSPIEDPGDARTVRHHVVGMVVEVE